MFQYSCLNPIAQIGLDGFDGQYEKTDDVNAADAVLVRSAAMHDMELSDKLCAIARAGAGVNNIPLDKCADQGIVVFNTPGANANGVKEMVVSGMLLAARDIAGGMQWVKDNADDENISKSMEKAKKNFAGTELKGKKLGVIGLGAIGVLVANVARHFGMEIYGVDPFLSVNNALSLSRDVTVVKSYDELYQVCDYITIHVPYIPETKGMLNKEAFDQMKDGVVILNFARDLLVNDDDMKAALESGKVRRYVTDFPNPAVVKMPNVIATPHLGASTAESEDNCAVMAVHELREFLENGNIINSVNYPNCDAGVCNTEGRITVAHKNIPTMLTQFTNVFAEEGINIAHMTNKSRGDYSYCVFDIDAASSKALEELETFSRAVSDIVDMSVNIFEKEDVEEAKHVEPFEEAIDVIQKEMKKRHSKRLRKGKCTVELGFVLSDITNNYERIADHCSNIAISVMQLKEDETHAHEYVDTLPKGEGSEFDIRLQSYLRKYELP